MSKHLGRLQVRGVNQLGDAMLPGDGDFASFSASGCVSEVDRVLDPMPERDRADLKMLLALMGLLPRFVVALFLSTLERSVRWGAWAAQLRFVRLGVRGLVMTLYYNHPQAHRVLGYKVGVYTDDVRGGSAQVRATSPSGAGDRVSSPGNSGFNSKKALPQAAVSLGGPNDRAL